MLLGSRGGTGLDAMAGNSLVLFSTARVSSLCPLRPSGEPWMAPNSLSIFHKVPLGSFSLEEPQGCWMTSAHGEVAADFLPWPSHNSLLKRRGARCQPSHVTWCSLLPLSHLDLSDFKGMSLCSLTLGSQRGKHWGSGAQLFSHSQSMGVCAVRLRLAERDMVL